MGDTMRGCCPKVPQQPNFSDCGIFLLQYIESFFENPLSDYSLPITSLRSWFPGDVVKNKRSRIAKTIRELAAEQHPDKKFMFPELVFSSLQGSGCTDDEDDDENGGGTAAVTQAKHAGSPSQQTATTGEAAEQSESDLDGDGAPPSAVTTRHPPIVTQHSTNHRQACKETEDSEDHDMEDHDGDEEDGEEEEEDEHEDDMFDLEADIPQQTIRTAPPSGGVSQPPPTRIPLTAGQSGSPPAKVVRINPAAGASPAKAMPVMPRLTQTGAMSSSGDKVSQDGNSQEEKPQTSPDSPSQILPKDVKSKSNEAGDTSGDTQDPSVDSSEDTSDKKKRSRDQAEESTSEGATRKQSPARSTSADMSNSKKQK